MMMKFEDAAIINESPVGSKIQKKKVHKWKIFIFFSWMNEECILQNLDISTLTCQCCTGRSCRGRSARAEPCVPCGWAGWIRGWRSRRHWSIRLRRGTWSSPATGCVAPEHSSITHPSFMPTPINNPRDYFELPYGSFFFYRSILFRGPSHL